MKLDSRLRHLLSQREQPRPELAERVGLGRGVPAGTVEVLVRYAGGEAELESLREDGLKVRFTVPGAYSVASGEASLAALDRFGERAFVARVEASRPMVPDLDCSQDEIRATMVHQADSPQRGAGVIVGIVDSGIDYTHPDFRNDDGTSRILFLWDQGVPAPPATAVPYGREYTKADLDSALASADPLTIARHHDVMAHGTHVAGIAAGNGRASADRFTGTAPEAGLIVVALDTEGVTLGRSVRAFDAFTYIVERSARRPVAINMSQGMNGGGHAGETVLETGLDNLLRQPGVVIVKSAGNEQPWRIHAGGWIGEGETAELEVQVETNDHTDSIVELWYGGDDQIAVAVQPPGETGARQFILPGGRRQELSLTGNRVTIDSERDADDTGDGMVTVILSRGSASFIQPGTWRLLLQGVAIRTGRYDAWIERTQRDPRGQQSRFSPACADNTRTISIPGTAKRIITVASYVTRRIPELGGPAEGEISVFSSRRPSRYGLPKPELAAPGEWIVSARSAQSKARKPLPDLPHYTAMAGTSMAAPHVAGAAGLMLAAQPALTCEQVKQILMYSARRDGVAASAPDDVWGSGRLDVEAAIRLAGSVRFSTITAVQVSGSTFRWQTDIPTTAALRYHTHQRQLQLGRSLGSQTVLTLRTHHEVTLAGVTPGTYYCEIVAFSAENWWTVNDKAGVFYVVEIGTPLSEGIEVPRSSGPQIVQETDHVIIAGVKIPVRAS